MNFAEAKPKIKNDSFNLWIGFDVGVVKQNIFITRAAKLNYKATTKTQTEECAARTYMPTTNPRQIIYFDFFPHYTFWSYI